MTDNTFTKVIDTTFYSLGFPTENWEKLIHRSNYLYSIADTFAQGVEVVFISGEEDSGKTILCAQYARIKPERTLTVFFNHQNNLDYTIEYYCSNIVPQIIQILKEENISESEDSAFNIEQYPSYTFKLRRYLKRQGDKVTLILDGLENKVKDDKDFIKKLFALVPIGEDVFRIIITGNDEDFFEALPKLKKNQNTFTHRLTGFSLLEIKEYLELTNEQEYETNDLFKVTKGFPGRLKTLKRLLQTNDYSLEKITKTTTYNSWIEIDCDQLDLENPALKVILALLALTERSFTSEEIAGICSLDLEKVEDILTGVTIVEKVGKNINFVSVAHKRYVSNLLRSFKKSIRDLQISYYASIDSTSSLTELPKLYVEGKQWTKVIEVIDSDHISQLLENTGSLKAVNDSLEMGVKASGEMRRYPDMWRYSIQGSIVNELDNYLFWESEIEARMAIQDFAGAISLAQSAILKIDRLNLLALIARRQKEFSNKVDEDLARVIEELYKITDLHTIGPKIYDVVANLIYAVPNIAIEMIEKSAGHVSEESINDWVIAKLSLAAIDSSTKENEIIQTSKRLEALQHLNNPAVKKINRAISFLVGKHTSKTVLDEVNKLTDSKEKLRLLRLWLRNNRDNIQDIDLVVQKALDELVKSSNINPATIEVLKELSMPLPSIENKERQKSLLAQFKLLERDFSELGLTKDKYIFQLNIFHTEYLLQMPSAIPSINKLLGEIDNLNDSLIKVDSFSAVYVKLREIQQTGEIAKKIKFVHSQILILSKELFDSTANHYNTIKYTLQTIGKQNPILGLSICDLINTVESRDQSRLLILDSYLSNSIKRINPTFVSKIEISLERESKKEVLLLNLLERYSEEITLDDTYVKNTVEQYTKILHFKDTSDRLRGLILFYKITCLSQYWKPKMKSRAIASIRYAWEKIESDWEKIDSGFAICTELAKVDNQFVKEIFHDTEAIKTSSWIDSNIVANTYVNSLKLIIRSYAGLLKTRNETKKDFNTIREFIDRIPSEVEKINAWTEAAFHANNVERPEEVKKIMDSHILPLFNSLEHKKINLEELTNTLTLIYIYNPTLANQYIEKFSFETQEDVYDLICNYYITKMIPYEIYSRKDFKNDCSYSDLTIAVNLIDKLEIDVNIYYQIANMCRAINDNRSFMSSPQITTLASAISDIINKKLPDKRNIKHDGYKILATVKITKLKKDVNHKVFWQSIIDEANNIPNLSDRIFVKAGLLEDLPFDKMTNGKISKSNLFEEIIRDLNKFKTHYEFANGVIYCTDVMYKIDKTRWKEVINRAFNLSVNLESGVESYQAQKRMIDAIYRIDPSYAKELIKLIDSPKAKNSVNSFVQSHFDALELSNKIKNSKPIAQKEMDDHLLVVQGVLESLAALNSNKITTKKIGDVCGFLPLGNKLPLHMVFPVFMFYLNNCSKTYNSTKSDDYTGDLHRGNFKEAVEATKLIELLSFRKKQNENATRLFFIEEAFETNIASKPGTRAEGLEWVKDWIDSSAEEFIMIVDPYFKKEDLEILKIVKQLKPSIEVEILGSVAGLQPDTEMEFKEYWSKISDELPPHTNITFCWKPGEGSSPSPFHDRWIISQGGGVRSGTSFSAIGESKDSELSIMKPNEAMKIKEETINEYITRRKKYIGTTRLAYKSFTL